MFNRHNEPFLSLLVLLDLSLVVASWFVAFELRFHTGLPVIHGVPEREAYILPLAIILPMWFLLYQAHGLYRPRRSASTYEEAMLLIRANALGVLVLVAITFFIRSYTYSRGMVGIFAVLAPLSAIVVRALLRLVLRSIRRRGYNLRHVVVVGSGRLAKEVIDRIHGAPEAGLRIVGIFSGGLDSEDDRLQGVTRLGGFADLKPFLAENPVDQVTLAMERDEWGGLEKVVKDLDDEATSIRFVPDLMQMMTLRSSVEDLDGLPVINLRETPLGKWAGKWAGVRKRLFGRSGV